VTPENSRSNRGIKNDVSGEFICQDERIVAEVYQSAVAGNQKLWLPKKSEPPSHRND
jgi:hypothetical protein